MERKQGKKKAEAATLRLSDLVFSWSLKDILNKNLYKDKVKTIPETFSSVPHYLTSFIHPLIEETHADLLSSMKMVSQAPLCEILWVEPITGDDKPPNNYLITVKGMQNTGNDAEVYELVPGDLIAFTDVIRPKCISDLDRPKRSYLVALVVKKPERDIDELPPEIDSCTVVSSKPIEFEQNIRLFGVSLINMTTNNRIFAALNMEKDKGNKRIIQNVLQPNNSSAEEECALCSSDSVSNTISESVVSSFNLNDSQNAAVLSCIAARECHHRNSVKQIWGPPGTGKTKTVATLLFALYRMKCRTLTCAPTNIAVLAVTKRLVGLVRDSNEDGTYRLGDIVLFGNYKRMKIKDHGDLCEVFLDVRLKILAKCFHWHTGWKKSLDSMICLLEEPKEMYSKYLREGMIQGEGKEVQAYQENEEDNQSQSFNKDRSKLIQGPKGVQANQEKEGNQSQSFNKDRGKSEKRWMRKDIEQTLKNNEKGKKQQDKNGKGATDRSPEKVLTLEEFFKKKFDDIVGNQEKEGNQSQSFNKDRGKSEKRWMRKDIEQTLKNNEKGKKQQDKNGKGATDRSPEKVLTLEEFFKKKFDDIVGNQEEGNQSQSFNKDTGKSEKRWMGKDIEQTLKNNEKGKKQQDKNGKGATDRSPEKFLTLEEFFEKKFDDIVGNQEKEGNQSQSFNKDRGKREKRWMRKDIEQTLKNNEKGKRQQDKNGKGATDRSPEKVLTLEEFFKKKFYDIVGNLKFCIPKLLKHLPTSLITLEVANNMIAAQSLLESLTTLLRSAVEASTSLKEVIDEIGIAGKSVGRFCKFHVTRIKLIGKLRCLQTIEVPNTTCSGLLKSYCLRNATLLFCTASSSAKIPAAEKPIELLIIDEAAQLKECESAIPLQIPGIRHAILIGDELQLPAMVISKISEKAKFGRSLFQRLVLLGHKKHLLNLQYRMHPSISLFPNKEFYDNLILDASNVKETSYNRSYLEGNMYNSYSFINVAYGKEELDNGCSTKNMVEVVVISEMIANLSKAIKGRKQMLSVGIISPYKAQVYAIQDRLGKKYTSSADSKFSVSVRSVDGFQGGEEDVIIISTVRCNLNGSVGFLSNRQRANVALTRARYCLWILGNGPTLEHSGTVWGKLVNDAKDRGCFHNAEDDDNLARAITTSLVEIGELDLLQKKDSLLFKKAPWKVQFSDDFWKSMVRTKSVKIRDKVFCLLEKLSSGWRRHDNQENLKTINGICSQLLEQYKVTKLLNLVWSVDILKEDSNYIQVLKVWDILPVDRTSKLAARLEILFGNYRVVDMDRCKFKYVQGNLEVPMTWAVEDEPEQLSRSFKSLILRG